MAAPTTSTAPSPRHCLICMLAFNVAVAEDFLSPLHKDRRLSQSATDHIMIVIAGAAGLFVLGFTKKLLCEKFFSRKLLREDEDQADDQTDIEKKPKRTVQFDDKPQRASETEANHGRGSLISQIAHGRANQKNEAAGTRNSAADVDAQDLKGIESGSLLKAAVRADEEHIVSGNAVEEEQHLADASNDEQPNAEVKIDIQPPASNELHELPNSLSMPVNASPAHSIGSLSPATSELTSASQSPRGDGDKRVKASPRGRKAGDSKRASALLAAKKSKYKARADAVTGTKSDTLAVPDGRRTRKTARPDRNTINSVSPARGD